MSSLMTWMFGTVPNIFLLLKIVKMHPALKRGLFFF